MMICFKSLLVIAFAVVALAVAASGFQRVTETACENKKDGSYALGICLPEYLVCSNGTSFVDHCDSGLFFDEATEECVDKNTTDGCSANKSCAGRENGFHHFGCSNVYLSCYNGSGMFLQCNTGYVFNWHSQECDFSCESTSVSQLNISNHFTTNDSFELASTSSHIFCGYHGNGLKSFGCRDVYLSCYDGNGLLLYCDAGRVFNWLLQKCELYCGRVPVSQLDNSVGSNENSGHWQRSNGSNENDDHNPIKYFRGSETVDFIVHRNINPHKICARRENGYQPVGCSEVYLSCYNGNGLFLQCDPGNIFNWFQGKCAPYCGLFPEDFQGFDFIKTLETNPWLQDDVKHLHTQNMYPSEFSIGAFLPPLFEGYYPFARNDNTPAEISEGMLSVRAEG